MNKNLKLFIGVLIVLVVLFNVGSVNFVNAQTQYINNHDAELGTLDYWGFAEPNAYWVQDFQYQEGSYAFACGFENDYFYQFVDNIPSEWLIDGNFTLKAKVFGIASQTSCYFLVHFSDGTEVELWSGWFDGNDGWIQLNFTGYEVANRFVNAIAFRFDSDSPTGYFTTVYFDDITFNQGTYGGTGVGGFKYTISGGNVIYSSNETVILMQDVDYIFYGTILNASGLRDYDVDGSYWVYFQYEGNWFGEYYDGQLAFAINARSHISNFTEPIAILIDSESGDNLEVIINLVFLMPDVYIPDNPDQVNLYDYFMNTTTVRYMVSFMFIVIPAFIFGSFGSEKGFGIQGAVVGTVIGAFVAYNAEAIGFAFMFLLGIVSIFLLLLSRRGS